jgi:hypothetical protein
VRALIAALGATLIFGACTGGGDSNVTDTGKGRPQLSIEFPERTEPGQVYDAVLTVANPGPGDMDTIAVAFATIAPTPGAQEMPLPLIGPGRNEANPSIVSVHPEPSGISQDAVVFTFRQVDGAPRLKVGDSLEITFSIRVPVTAGVAGASVQVYDGQEIDRAAGVRLQTSVGR